MGRGAWQGTVHRVARVGHNCHDLAAAAAADMCTPVFIAALFTIARTWNQPRYPSADEWIRKLWYIYTME